MKQKRSLLYIGNKLASSGKPPSAIDSLSINLEMEGYSISTASTKANKVFRMFDMIFTTFKNSRKADLVLIDTYSTQNFIYAVIFARICRLCKLPYVPILHGGNLPNRLMKSKKRSQNLFGKALTNVAPSKYILEEFKKRNFENLTYIPNTIEIENYPFKLRKKISPKLLWVRSFSEIYNPMLALEIVEILKNEGIDVSLCMVGPDKDGSLERCKKVVKELNLPVTFTGMLTKKEWIALSKKFDIFINTTNFDNMPVSVMEAMALGLPVISTDVGGMPFLIENKNEGVLLPKNNAQAFANAIQDLCNNSTKTLEISQAARFKMEQFDWQQVKHTWIKLLDA